MIIISGSGLASSLTVTYTVPDHAQYTNRHGDLDRTVPTESVLYNCFYNKNHTIRRQFRSTETDAHGDTYYEPLLTFYEDDGTTILEEFKDSDGDFLQLFHADGSFVLLDNGPVTSSPTVYGPSPDPSTAIVKLTDALKHTKATEGMPNLQKWDGNPKTWHVFR